MLKELSKFDTASLKADALLRFAGDLVHNALHDEVSLVWALLEKAASARLFADGCLSFRMRLRLISIFASQDAETTRSKISAVLGIAIRI